MIVESMTVEEIAASHRLHQGGLSLDAALDAARAGRLWAVDTNGRGADALVDASDERDAISVVADHEEDDEEIRYTMAMRWSAARVELA